jgi:hypothetical protein
MKTLKNVVVKSAGKPVDLLAIEVPESFDEARQFFGDDVMLDLAVKQWTTNHKNRSRSAANSGPTEAQLEKEAWDSVTPEEFNAIRGDRVKREQLIESKKAHIKAEWDVRRAAKLAEVKAKVSEIKGSDDEGDGEGDDE